MDEKIILESNNNYAKKLKTVSIVCVLFSTILCYFCCYTPWMILSLSAFILSLCLLIFAITIQKTRITVSDKRVYGITTFGKRVDLPLDSISAVGMSLFNGITIGTSSGRIVFKGIGNRDELHNVISRLLVDRQNKEKVVSSTTINQGAPQSNADELKKFKELLDSGVITQEEFDAKKKQLLGL